MKTAVIQNPTASPEPATRTSALEPPSSPPGPPRKPAGGGATTNKPVPVRNGPRPVDIAFLFRVRSDDGVIGDFQAVEGLSHTIEVKEYPEGGRNHGAQVLFGPAKQGRLTLKSGIMTSRYLYAWLRSVQLGRSFRRDLMVTQLTRAGDPLRVFTLEGAWPVEWKAPPLDATQSSIPVEELVLVFDALNMEVMDDVG